MKKERQREKKRDTKTEWVKKTLRESERELERDGYAKGKKETERDIQRAKKQTYTVKNNFDFQNKEMLVYLFWNQG